jgi:hypothetical protein
VTARIVSLAGFLGGTAASEILLLSAGSSFSSFEVFEDCSGGNSRLSYLLWCGGRSFFDHERKPHRGIEPPVRFLNALLLSPCGAFRLIAAAAFGVFGWFQVTDFDGFLSFFLHFILLSCFGWLFLLCQWHRTAIDARL